MKVRINDVGRKRKNKHRLPSSVSSTQRFGFCEPILCRELCAQDSVRLRIGQSIYLNPMAKPTFGACNCKVYKQFVPIADIYHPFESLMSGQTYRGSGATYVPTQVPVIPQYYLSNCMKRWCTYHGYKVVNPTVTPDDYSFDSIGPYTGFSLSNLQWLTTKWRSDLGLTVAQLPDSFIVSNSLAVNITQNEDLNSYDFFEVFSGAQTDVLICGRFSSVSKNLRTVLIGLGYQMNDCQDPVTILPIIAYYKIWFDLFAPQRDKTWKDTYAYGLMEYIEQNNLAATWWKDSTAYNLWLNFLDYELSFCYYYGNTDYVSAHMQSLSTSTAIKNESFTSIDPSGIPQIITPTANGMPDLVAAGTGQVQLNVLRRLSARINQHSAIGGKIKSFLRAFFGSEYREDDESYFLGSQVTPIDISTVMNQAETNFGYLGQYAARGVGQSPGEYINYTAKCQGFLIAISVIVPVTNYAQAVDPQLKHIRRYDFYNYDFDSITMLPTPKYCIYGTRELSTYASGHMTSYSTGFGNIPNYMEYKCSYNRLNGEMSQMSRRASYLPFTLDKLLPYTYVEKDSSNNPKAIKNLSTSLLVAGDIWRSIGFYDFMGNFDRIFTNQGYGDTLKNYSQIGGILVNYNPLDDNFIVHSYIDLSVLSFNLAVKDSWMTDVDGEGTDIQQS